MLISQNFSRSCLLWIQWAGNFEDDADTEDKTETDWCLRSFEEDNDSSDEDEEEPDLSVKPSSISNALNARSSLKEFLFIKKLDRWNAWTKPHGQNFA